MIQNTIAVVPRFADLDTQRHVTSRTYESFAWEGRHKLLEAAGHSIQSLLERGVRLRPRQSSVAFQREQNPGARLEVFTEAEAAPGGVIYWRHRIVEAESGTLACTLHCTTQSEAAGAPVELLPTQGAAAAPEDSPAKEIQALPPIARFSGASERVLSRCFMPYSERSIFYDYPLTALWRLAEDGRWYFSTEIGLTEQRIRELDTITFFLAGNFEFYDLPRAGQELTIHTWLERIEKIRCVMRTDVSDAQSGAVLYSCRDEQLIVSLSRRRPRKAPPEFIELVRPYMESYTPD